MQWQRKAQPQQETYIHCQDLFKIHKVADLEVVALRGLDLRVNKGEMVAIVGPSGSGKSTLLHILAGYETPSAGAVSVGGRNLLKAGPGELVDYRRKGIGFVWQQVSRNLVPYLTAKQNVELPMLLDSRTKRQRTERAVELLKFAGLEERLNHTVDRLSGGEQQRVSVAVAMANNPPLLLCDEPTGELDTKTGQEIFNLLRAANTTYGTTVVIVTHDMEVAEQVDRVIAISDGKTSTEVVRRRSYQRQAAGETAMEELSIVDGTGRLQLPKQALERLGRPEHVRVSLEGDHIEIRTEGP
ncbi:MAG: ABC transporter ATP-binding protein [Chloroflexi bacterium]|nr:ABC transporter ATP-binding protein [Chloroflexota bacterium]